MSKAGVPELRGARLSPALATAADRGARGTAALHPLSRQGAPRDAQWGCTLTGAKVTRGASRHQPPR